MSAANALGRLSARVRRVNGPPIWEATVRTGRRVLRACSHVHHSYAQAKRCARRELRAEIVRWSSERCYDPDCPTVGAHVHAAAARTR